MDQSNDMLSDSVNKQCYSANFTSETDPLQEFGVEVAVAIKPKFYRMNSVIFAEPLNNTANEGNSSKDLDDSIKINIIENIIVQKEPGKKYKKYHFNIKEGSTSCPQPSCHRTFPTIKHLTAHIRKVHCTDRARYVCEQCGRGFPERYMLRRHADTHSENTKQCPVCGVKLRLRTSLASHLRSHSNERPHECEICKKAFGRASSKAMHVKFVHREGMLECDECDKRFSSRKQWTLHMTTHREKKPN